MAQPDRPPTPQQEFNAELMLHIADLKDLMERRVASPPGIADVITRMDRLDARLASLENVYADVRRAQNDAEAKTTLIIGPRPPDKS